MQQKQKCAENRMRDLYAPIQIAIPQSKFNTEIQKILTTKGAKSEPLYAPQSVSLYVFNNNLQSSLEFQAQPCGFEVRG